MNLYQQIKEYCRDRHAKCPHCGKEVSPKQRMVYFWRGTAHYINCEHCGGAMHPAREPISTQLCFQIGFFTTTILAFLYWQLVLKGSTSSWIYFFEAYLFVLPVVLVIFIITCILTYNRIEFSI